MNTRQETDSMGAMEVPLDALYGASTQRAVLNFPISDRGMPRPVLHALGLLKWSAALTNREIGRLDEERAGYAARAAEELADGLLDAHFPVDVFQTGSGTSTNMNANEVIANRASILAGKTPGSHEPLHPNDHVNLGQSSNDVFPSALHVAAAMELEQRLLPALRALQRSLSEKATAFQAVIKIGRTHLMDATPVTMGAVFSGYACQIEKSSRRVRQGQAALFELPLGGTAVGTGLNTHPEFARRTIARLSDRLGLPFVEATNHFEAQSARDGMVECSASLRSLALSLTKIANDIRWMGSGPRCGIGELRLPPVQPGSSIMPGKVNPVIAEALLQVCADVVGADATIAWCAAQGNFELNVMMPIMGVRLLESIERLGRSVTLFQSRCIDGLEVDQHRCHELVEKSFALVTALVPRLGYDRAAEIAKESLATGRSIRQVCEEAGLLTSEELALLLDPSQMLHPR
ncbi:MAG: class II fumarate hydratase [Verrucomicrobiia bacterium]